MTRREQSGAASGRPNPLPVPTIGDYYQYLFTGLGADLTKDQSKKLERFRGGATPDFVETESSLYLVLRDYLVRIAGNAWADRIGTELQIITQGAREFARKSDSTCVPHDRGWEHYVRCAAPIAAEILRAWAEQTRGPSLKDFLKAPFATWFQWGGQIEFKGSRSDDADSVRNHVRKLGDLQSLIEPTYLKLRSKDNDQSIEPSWRRWTDGKPISALTGEIVSKALPTEVPVDSRHLVIGWFLIARLLQNGSPAWKKALAELPLEPLPPQVNLADLFAEEANKVLQPTNHYHLGVLFRSVKKLLEHPSTSKEDVAVGLAELDRSIKTLPSPANRDLRYIGYWLRALSACRFGSNEQAGKLFDRAIKWAWWRAGEAQELILEDALLHAIWAQDKVRAKRLWDRGFFLGLNDYGKPRLEDSPEELARLKLAAENRFERVSTPMLQIDLLRNLIRTGKRNPNQISNVSKTGRFRMTPLIAALHVGDVGDLEDVAKLLGAGADVSSHIPETGETALSVALRNATTETLDKANAILDALPNLESRRGDPDSWNRPVGGDRTWPLALAIDLAQPNIVKRLLDLGVNTAKPCRSGWPPLYYTLLRLAWGESEEAKAQLLRYLGGEGYPSVSDARLGAVYRSELSEVRRRAFLAQTSSPRHAEIFQTVMDIVMPALDQTAKDRLIEIVGILVASMGKDAPRHINQFVLPGPGEPAKWTALHLAAEIGNPKCVQMLLDAGANAEIGLQYLGSGNHPTDHDAMWIAVRKQNDGAIKVLQDHFAKRVIH